MSSVYDSENFQGRVDYATLCFLRGTSSTRHFDTCFEMFDDDAVVTALVRRAEKNHLLHNAIASRFGGTFPQGWTETASRYAQYPRGTLAKLAKRLREEGDRRSQEMLARITSRRDRSTASSRETMHLPEPDENNETPSLQPR